MDNATKGEVFQGCGCLLTFSVIIGIFSLIATQLGMEGGNKPLEWAVNILVGGASLYLWVKIIPKLRPNWFPKNQAQPSSLPTAAPYKPATTQSESSPSAVRRDPPSKPAATQSESSPSGAHPKHPEDWLECTELEHNKGALAMFDGWQCNGKLAGLDFDPEWFEVTTDILYSAAVRGRETAMASVADNPVHAVMTAAYHSALGASVVGAYRAYQKGDMKNLQWFMEEGVLSGRDLRNPTVIALCAIIVCQIGTSTKNSGYWDELATACISLGDVEGASFARDRSTNKA